MDSAKIDGNIDFPCPKCGVRMSPEDQKENIYSIKEIRTRSDRLEELVTKYNTCESLIHLAGFRLLDSLNCYA